jgi:hypothetical protein
VCALVGLAGQLLLAAWRRCHWQRRSPLRPRAQYNSWPSGAEGWVHLTMVPHSAGVVWPGVGVDGIRACCGIQQASTRIHTIIEHYPEDVGRGKGQSQ